METIQRVREAGIVGAGGAGFPTHVKLAAKAEYFILNSAECEPLLRVDQQLIKANAPKIIEGIKLIMESVGAKKAFIGIKGKHKEAINILRENFDESDISLVLLEDFYPAGDEQVLVYEVLKRCVPEMGIPLKVNCVVMNTETVLNLYNSMYGNPVVDTYLTVTGKVEKPVTLKIPIGASVSDVLNHCGIKNMIGIRVIEGGPMMGKVLKDLDEPITKTTKGLIILDEDHSLIAKKTVSIETALRISKVACEQCRMCTDLCPRYLLGHNMQPHKIMRKISYNFEDIKDVGMAQLCCECNLCELYACPVNIKPKSINVLYKQKLVEEGIKYIPETKEIYPRVAREYRKVPVKRLINKLGLTQFDVEAPLLDTVLSLERVKIPLKQHTGAQAIPIVSLGQQVKRGELIGEIPENQLGARVHASIDGIVTEVSQYVIIEKRG